MILAWLVFLWLAVSPFAALAIGISRGQARAGWLCGLVPFAGPFLAARLIPPRPVKAALPQP